MNATIEAHNGITHYMAIFVRGISQLIRDGAVRVRGGFVVTKSVAFY